MAEIRSHQQAVRETLAKYQLPEDATRLANSACYVGDGDIETVVLERCSATRWALSTLGALRSVLTRHDLSTLDPINYAKGLNDLAEMRAHANERAWSAAISFNVEVAYSVGYYTPSDALGLVGKLAAACDVDRLLMMNAVALLQRSREPTMPASYRALVVEVNAAVELAVSPRGSLNSYQQAIANSDQSVDRARLTALSEPAPQSAEAPNQ